MANRTLINACNKNDDRVRQHLGLENGVAFELVTKGSTDNSNHDEALDWKGLDHGSRSAQS